MGDSVTLDDLPSLKEAYEKATKKGLEEFAFKNSILVTQYAKYLIEYLETLK